MYKELGEMIREKRVELGRTAAVVSRQLDVSAAYYSRIETGRIRPSRQMLERIGERLRFSMDELRKLNDLAKYTTSASEVSPMKASSGKTIPVTEYAPIYADPGQPVLYIDAMYMLTTDNGVVLEFGQKAAASQATVVARLGMSYTQARRIQEVLKAQLAKSTDVGIDS